MNRSTAHVATDMTMMRTRTIFAFSILTLLGCSPITYTRKLESGAQTTFVGGRLNGPEVSVDTIEAGGSRFTFEHSTFVYMFAEPFQSFQSVGSITPADPTASLRLDPSELAGFVSAL